MTSFRAQTFHGFCTIQKVLGGEGNNFAKPTQNKVNQTFKG